MEGRACVLPLCHQGDATPSSEVRDALEEVEVTNPNAALAIPSPEVPAKESGLSGAAGTGQDPDASKETVGSIDDAPVSHVEGPVIVVKPL